MNPRIHRINIVDVVPALVLSILLLPMILCIALVIMIIQGHPIVFSQIRVGYCGKPFRMYKFCTMSDKRDEGGRLLPDRERLTRLGKFLRRTSLDELTELYNVLKGEMRLVGPRPLLMQYLGRYTSEQMRRHEVKPGITGWAQVNGRNAISWEEKFKLDVWYVDHHSILLDLKILVLTVWKILRREGISQTGHATMEEFYGSE
jgi:sugar transferase EpsL